jgi:hypothetical protein
LEDAGPAKSNFPAAAWICMQDSAGSVEGVDRCLLSRSLCSRRERRRPRLGGDFGRAGAQRRRSGELARRWSRRVGKHLQPRLSGQELVRKFFTARVGKGRDRQLTTLAFRNIFDETLARRREAPKDHPEKQDGIRVFRMHASNRPAGAQGGRYTWVGWRPRASETRKKLV